MIENTKIQPALAPPVGSDLQERIKIEIQKASKANKGFFIIMLQLENMETFRKRRPSHVVNGLMREMFQAVRHAVHPSQYVGYYRDGLVLIFDRVEVGQIDTISRRLVSLAQHVIRTGRYNDLTSRWTDILYEFLCPNKPCILYTRVGWAIYPRDGEGATSLLNRAIHHKLEISRVVRP
jgi:GGDEF domain-containing protein